MSQISKTNERQWDGRASNDDYFLLQITLLINQLIVLPLKIASETMIIYDLKVMTSECRHLVAGIANHI